MENSKDVLVRLCAQKKGALRVPLPLNPVLITLRTYRRMVNVNAMGPFNLPDPPASPSYRPDYSSSHADFYDPVDSRSISQAYPEHHIPDIDSLRHEGRNTSRSSSRSYRSVERAPRTPSMALSARIITLDSLEAPTPVMEEATKVSELFTARVMLSEPVLLFARKLPIISASTLDRSHAVGTIDPRL